MKRLKPILVLNLNRTIFVYAQYRSLSSEELITILLFVMNIKFRK